MDLFEFISNEEKQEAASKLKEHHFNVAARRNALKYHFEQKTYQQMLDSVADWQLPDLPDLSRFDEVFIDCETTGLRWYDGDRMIGIGLWTPDGVGRYLPIRHKIGVNHDPAKFFDWVRREVRGKKVTNIRTKLDLHFFRADGIDLEAQGCTFGDVAHYAALLDDHRAAFNQEDLALHYLAKPGILTPEECKVHFAHGYDLDPSKFAEYPAGLVADRGVGDVRIVAMLKEAMWPLMTDQDLHRVRAVEEGVIPVVVEMEHNGCPIDQERLAAYIKGARAEMDDAILQIEKHSGWRIDGRITRDTLMRLFPYLKVPIPVDIEGKVTFADSHLKGIQHEGVQQCRRWMQLDSLLSKFLLKYERSTSRDGILRYELHQLPYERDQSEGGEGGGAVSGRFSSAAMSYFNEEGTMQQEGANIQQVFAVKNQMKERPYTKDYIVRALHVPGSGEWLACDASQIEYRGFAHFSNARKIVEAYKDDLYYALHGIIDEKTGKQKGTDYHQLVQDLIKQFTGVELHREATKRVNFAQVYGAGVPKMATQLGVPEDQIPSSQEWGEAIRMGKQHEIGGPEFQKVVKLSDTYHEMFPEVKPLLRLASHLAKPGHDDRCGKECRRMHEKGYTHRGFVKTILGRRARFGSHDRHYSAANRVIQGTAADLNKIVLIEVHKMRHELGLTPRMTVHDEWDGDLQDRGLLPKIREVFNTQYLDLRVPITWEVGVGRNWAEAK